MDRELFVNSLFNALFFGVLGFATFKMLKSVNRDHTWIARWAKNYSYWPWDKAFYQKMENNKDGNEILQRLAQLVLVFVLIVSCIGLIFAIMSILNATQPFSN